MNEMIRIGSWHSRQSNGKHSNNRLMSRAHE